MLQKTITKSKLEQANNFHHHLLKIFCNALMQYLFDYILAKHSTLSLIRPTQRN